MPKDAPVSGFAPLNRAYDAVFRPGALSIGLVAPLDAHGHDPVPDLTRHVERAQLADRLGFRSGTDFLRRYLAELRGLGINHVALNLRFASGDIEDTMHRLAEALLPEFSNAEDHP